MDLEEMMKGSRVRPQIRPLDRSEGNDAMVQKLTNKPCSENANFTVHVSMTYTTRDQKAPVLSLRSIPQTLEIPRSATV